MSTTPKRGRKPDPQRWTTFLTHLRAWAHEHGHTRVPQHHVIDTPDGPYPLGLRTKFYRAAHLQRHALTPEQIAELDAIPGWTWRTLPSRWQDTLDQVAHHVHTHATTDNLPPATYAWLRRQRTATLTDDQRAQLATIPGALDPDPLDQFLAAANTWLDAHPDQPITAVKFRDTTTLPDGTTYPLGRRITYFRRRTTGQEGTHPLPQHDVARLAQLRGWTDEPRRTTAPSPTPATTAVPEAATTPVTGKYRPLADHLRSRPGQRTTITFDTISGMVRGGLPASAHSHRAWWANELDGRHVHARSWMNTGWRVSSVNLERGTVTFVRTTSGPGSVAARR